MKGIFLMQSQIYHNIDHILAGLYCARKERGRDETKECPIMLLLELSNWGTEY